MLSISLPLWALLGAWTLRRQPWLLAALLALLAVAPLGILAFAVVRPLFSGKQFLWTAIPFFLLAACGIAAIRPKPLFAVALIALLVEGAVKLDRYYAVQTKTDWRRLVATVAGAAPSDSLLVVSPDGNLHVVGYYLQRLGVPPAHIALLGLPPGSDGAPRVEATRSDRPLWLLLNPNTQPAVATAAERSAMLSEQARADSIRLYRLEPWDSGLNGGATNSTPPFAGGGPRKEYSTRTTKSVIAGLDPAIQIRRPCRDHGPDARVRPGQARSCPGLTPRVDRRTTRAPAPRSRAARPPGPAARPAGPAVRSGGGFC